MQAGKNDTSERRFEIECKLESEIATLEALRDAEEKNRKLTNGVVAILTSLEQRLANLRRTILPVYNETGNLQSQQHNIERTLTALDNAIGYYGVCEEVELSVKNGPNGAGGIDGFLDSMNRLYNAERYFQKNNPTSVELVNISTLFNIGLDLLCTEFNDILTRQSKPILPIILLDLIGNDDDDVADDDGGGGDDDTSINNNDNSLSLNQLSDSVINDLIKISVWLDERGHRRHVDIYSSARSSIVLRSLQLLKEHQRSSSGGSTHASSPMPKSKFSHRYSIGGIVVSGGGSGVIGTSSSNNVSSNSIVGGNGVNNIGDLTGRRTPRRLQHAIEKKASKMFMRASQTTGLSFPTSRKPSLNQPLNYHHLSDDAAPDEQEMDNYLLLTAGLHKLMQAEKCMISKIIPLLLQPQVLEATVRDAMDLVAHDGESIATRAKRCIARRDYSSVLVVFPILKHLSELKPDLERTVEGCDYALRSKFASVLNTLNSTGAKALEDFSESVRNESGAALPKDGTVAESTSNVLVFLEQLSENSETAGIVLCKNNEIESIPTSSAKQIDNYRILLGVYIKKVLAQLNLALVSKSDASYSDPALRALFRLNNHNYVIDKLKNSLLMELLLLAEPTADQAYQDFLIKDKTNYISATFLKARSYLEQSLDEPEIAAKSLKERFSGFSRELEETTKNQRLYSVPDSRLRELLRNELQQAIVPCYTIFYNKYRFAPFSKNPGKYIKYTPEQVISLIKMFFDTSA